MRRFRREILGCLLQGALQAIPLPLVLLGGLLLDMGAGETW